MIKFEVDHIELNIDTAKALLMFAADKKSSTPAYACVGLTKNRLAATDGHALVLFDGVGNYHADLENQLFPRVYVERQLKLAQVDKCKVSLAFVDLASQVEMFPNVDIIVPQDMRKSCPDHTPLVAEYLARLVAVQSACYPKGGKHVGRVHLTGTGHQWDAVRFDCGRHTAETEEKATVVFMPTRAQ